MNKFLVQGNFNSKAVSTQPKVQISLKFQHLDSILVFFISLLLLFVCVGGRGGCFFLLTKNIKFYLNPKAITAQSKTQHSRKCTAWLEPLPLGLSPTESRSRVGGLGFSSSLRLSAPFVVCLMSTKGQKNLHPIQQPLLTGQSPELTQRIRGTGRKAFIHPLVFKAGPLTPPPLRGLSR